MPVTCPPPPRAPLLPSRPPCAVISARDADALVRVSFRGHTALLRRRVTRCLAPLCQLAASYGYIWQASRFPWAEHSCTA
jgi:hypothetical protein